MYQEIDFEKLSIKKPLESLGYFNMIIILDSLIENNQGSLINNYYDNI